MVVPIADEIINDPTLNEKYVSSVANTILNNALHVYFLSNESNTLVKITEAECLYDFSFNSFCPYYSCLPTFLLFTPLLSLF